jgi:hypothetical protein
MFEQAGMTPIEVKNIFSRYLVAVIGEKTQA